MRKSRQFEGVVVGEAADPGLDARPCLCDVDRARRSAAEGVRVEPRAKPAPGLTLLRLHLREFERIHGEAELRVRMAIREPSHVMAASVVEEHRGDGLLGSPGATELLQRSPARSGQWDRDGNQVWHGVGLSCSEPAVSARSSSGLALRRWFP